MGEITENFPKITDETHGERERRRRKRRTKEKQRERKKDGERKEEIGRERMTHVSGSQEKPGTGDTVMLLGQNYEAESPTPS